MFPLLHPPRLPRLYLPKNKPCSAYLPCVEVLPTAAVTDQPNLAGVHPDEVLASDGTGQSERLHGVVASIIIIGRDSR